MLYYRQKLILGLLEEFGGSLYSTDFQKLLFLFCEKYKPDQRFHFVPYKQGCFSFQSYNDKQYLIENDYIEDKNYWKLNKKNVRYIDLLKNKDKENLCEFKNKYVDLKGDNLIKHVYLKYPYYTIRSEIAERILTLAEQKNVYNISNEISNNNSITLFTLGYEGISVEEYLNKLIKNNIKMVVDVRKNPLSRKYGFSKLQLTSYLKKFQILYLHMPELGIESDDRKELKTFEDFQKLFDYYEQYTLNKKPDSISKLFQLLLEHQRIALTCFEADYKMCHRSRIAKCIINSSEWEYGLNNL